MKISLTIAFLLCCTGAFSQAKEKQIGVGAQPFYSGRIWLQSPGGSKTIDSLNKADRGMIGISPQLWFFAEMGRKLTLQTGLSYGLHGFRRRSPEIRPGDRPHPGLPLFTDHVHGDPRYIDFMYRVHYLQMPVLFNIELLSLRKSISVKYFFSPGITLGFRTYNKTVAHTRGFGYDGKNRIVLNNIYQTNPLNVQLHLAGRLEYRLDGKYRTHFQPVLNIPLTSSLAGGNKAFVPSFGFNLAISVLTNKIGEKEGTE
jgi:hypothetical protein